LVREGKGACQGERRKETFLVVMSERGSCALQQGKIGSALPPKIRSGGGKKSDPEGKSLHSFEAGGGKKIITGGPDGTKNGRLIEGDWGERKKRIW